MKIGAAALPAVLALSACAPPHRFEIRSDEPIAAVEVDLANARKAEIRLSSAHRAVAEVHVADSGGEIRVALQDGQVVSCPVGYITNGEREPHWLIIKERRCNGI